LLEIILKALSICGVDFVLANENTYSTEWSFMRLPFYSRPLAQNLRN